MMKRPQQIVLAALLALGAAVSLPAQAEARVGVNIVIGSPPPPVRYEVVPVARPGRVWVPGYWNWNGRRHVWSAGHWERPRRGYVYQRPEWHRQQGGWYLEHGGWRPEHRAVSRTAYPVHRYHSRHERDEHRHQERHDRRQDRHDRHDHRGGHGTR